MKRACFPLILALAAGCTAAVTSPPASEVAAISAPSAREAALAERPRNVILLIGDGMGSSHVTLASSLRGDDFAIGRMPVAALVTTHSAGTVVTDSAAAATAIASGVKTGNGMVGVGPDGRSHRTVLEAAEASGRSTGLVTTTGFWDATPAAFAAHVSDRGDALAIGLQMLRKGVEVIASNGSDKFGVGEIPPLARVVDMAGYELAGSAEEMELARGERVLAIFPSQVNDVDAPEAPLPSLAEAAIRRLARDPDGFFLMIEHEGIDTSSHTNSNDDLRASLISFDQAVANALAFAESRSDTLVIVTGDHETGGLQLVGGASPEVIGLRWGGTGHTAEALPLFASGPGAAAFAGMIDNTDIAKMLFVLLGE